MTSPATLTRERAALALIERWFDLADDEQAARLAALRIEDPALGQLVDRLIANRAQADALFPTGAPGLSQLCPDALPDRIGPYRIDHVLGDGGMGIVLRGIRDDGLFDQIVAIKLIRAELSTVAAQERFVLERQILGRLESPAIARILDGGSWQGRPYLIMECVDGAPLTDYVRAAEPGLDERLRLFLAICEAVQYAHRRLIVHADIKPSNIMIARDGSVKLLDFGIAQLVGEEERIAEGGSPLTRAYASPERRAGARANIVSDIYSLGVVLFELLTGRTPNSSVTTLVIDADGRDRFTAPSSMVIDPAITARHVAGDLDAIVARACAAEPHDRYPDVASLIADIVAHRADRPIGARAPGWHYVGAKFVLRHRTGLLISAAIAFALIGITAFSLTQWLRADRAQREATARFNDARGAARYLLFDLMGKLESRPRSLVLRSEVAATAQRYLNRLSQARHAPDQVRLEAASGLWKLAEAQGKAGHPNLGQASNADANLRRAAAIAATLAMPGADLLRARIAIDRARLAANMEMDSARSERLLRRAKALVDIAAPRAPGLLTDYAIAFAEVRIWQGRNALAIAALKPELATAADWSRTGVLKRARMTDLTAEAIYYNGSPTDALAPYRAAMLLLERAHRRWPDDNYLLTQLARARWNLATSYEQVGRFADALPILERATAESRRSVAFDPADKAAVRNAHIIRSAYAQTLGQLHRSEEAVALLTAAAREQAAIWAADRRDPQKVRDYAMAMILIGEAQSVAGNRAQSCAADTKANQLYDYAAGLRAINKLDLDYNLKMLAARRQQNCIPAPRSSPHK